MNQLQILRAAAAAALCLSSAGVFAQVAIVVNPKSPLASMTADQVSAIFLGKSTAQVKAAWSRLVFSGKATPPKELASSAEVKKFVAANPDAIGYIEKSAVDSTVKVVFSAD